MGLQAHKNRESVVYKGVSYYRYPDSKRRTHRTYYLGGAKWKVSAKYLHRKMWEDVYGEIPKGFIVHHKDGDSSNNTIENLEIMSRKHHMELHMQEVERREDLREMMIINKAKVLKALKDYHKNKVAKEYVCVVCHSLFNSFSKQAKYCSKKCKWTIDNKKAWNKV